MQKERRPSNEALKKVRDEKEAEATAQVLATIDSMLVLIEAGDVEALLARYVYPPDVEQALSEQVTFEMLVQRLKEKGIERLETALREAKAIKPQWNDNLDRAYFEREGKDLVFVQYKGQWYLRN
ncbi:MAG: hypothetical protein ACK42Y_06905 [Candidatus Thermochlorobacter sp.]